MLQMGLCGGITFLLIENIYLELGILQRVNAAVLMGGGPLSRSVIRLSAGLWLLGVAIASMASVYYYLEFGAGFIEINELSLTLATGLGIALLLAKVVQYRRLKAFRHYQPQIGSPQIGTMPGQDGAGFTGQQANAYTLEKELPALLLVASQQERQRMYATIRQLALIDKIDLLEAVQENHLPADQELWGTIEYLKILREKLAGKGDHADIDAITDMRVAKAYIRKLVEEQKPMLLQKLLHDNRPEIKKAAILASVHFQETGLIPVLVNFLKEAEFAQPAREALFEIGPSCIPYLRSAQFRNKDNSFFVEQCLTLAERYTCGEARDFLLEMLNEAQARFRYQAGRALLRKGYALSSLHRTQFRQLVESLLACIAMEREIRINLKGSNAVLEASLLEEENEKFILLLDLLQAFLPASIHQYIVSAYMQAPAAADAYTRYALIDLFFPLVIRNKCKILLGSDRHKNIAPELQVEYVNEQIAFQYKKPAQAVKQLLRMDYGQIGFWLRVCALKHSGQGVEKKLSTQLLAEVFNENLLIQETALEVLYDLNYDYYFLYMQRLPQERAKYLKQKIDLYKTLGSQGVPAEDQLLFERVLFLKSVALFQNCTYESLARHITNFRLHNFQEGRWELRLDPYASAGYWIIYEGACTLYYKGEILAEVERGGVIDLSFLAETDRNTVTIQSNNLLQVYIVEYSTLNNISLSSGPLQNAVIQPYIAHAAKSLVV